MRCIPGNKVDSLISDDPSQSLNSFRFLAIFASDPTPLSAIDFEVLSAASLNTLRSTPVMPK